MQKSFEVPKLNDDWSFEGSSVDLVCDECGGTYQKPILAKFSRVRGLQTYYACPRCLTRVNQERKRIIISKKEVKKQSSEHENTGNCEHFFGYLKKRPKNEPISDGCLTCDKMIECLSS